MFKLKQYIFNHKIFSDLHRGLYTKAFSDASKDLEETNMYQTEQKAKELAETMLSNMLSVVDKNAIVTIDKNARIVFVGGEKADEARLASLKAEAEMIESTYLWKILHETPKQLAQTSMFVSGETLADMQKGKSMLYLLSQQQNILDTFLSYQQKGK